MGVAIYLPPTNPSPDYLFRSVIEPDVLDLSLPKLVHDRHDGSVLDAFVSLDEDDLFQLALEKIDELVASSSILTGRALR